MIEKVKAPTSVYSFYDHKKRMFIPISVYWEGQKYNTKKLGYHHSYRLGRILYHVYSIETDQLSFRLICNTENLSWEVAEVSDGQTD